MADLLEKLRALPDEVQGALDEADKKGYERGFNEGKIEPKPEDGGGKKKIDMEKLSQLIDQEEHEDAKDLKEKIKKLLDEEEGGDVGIPETPPDMPAPDVPEVPEVPVDQPDAPTGDAPTGDAPADGDTGEDTGEAPIEDTPPVGDEPATPVEEDPSITSVRKKKR